MSLVIPISRARGSLSGQIYRWLREAILQGKLVAAERLPASRDLAEQLRVSRTVVVLAYEQLLAEGYVSGRVGSGTYVSPGLPVGRTRSDAQPARIALTRFGSAAAQSAPRMSLPRAADKTLRYDFAYGRSEIETFPFAMWRRLLARHARKASVRTIDYGPAAGSVALRDAIAAHLRRSRAVNCDPEQVIVVSGSQQALDLIARVLIERGDRVVLEDPAYQGTREVLRAAGARILSVPVDDNGIDPSKLPREARAAFVTPSHQFPTGAILPLARRLALLDWARAAGATVIEDDYDGEFRYDDQPLESLQGLDAEGRVIYVGTFSRTVFSALRIGYLIVPKSLIDAFSAAKWLCDRHTATLEQETLAEFIASGMYERHLRRVRRRNASRRKALLDAVREHLSGLVDVSGAGAGAHVVLWPKKRVSEAALVKSAAARGVGVYGIAGYFANAPTRSGLMLGYSRLREAEIREGIKRLGPSLTSVIPA